MGDIIAYISSDNMINDICYIIDDAKMAAFKQVDAILVLRNWYIGKRIAEEELNGVNRAKYGEEIMDSLSNDLTKKYGKGFSRRAIYQYLKFFRMFPEIVHSVSTQLKEDEEEYIWKREELENAK